MDDKHVINCNDVPEIDMTRQDGGLEHKAGVYTYQIYISDGVSVPSEYVVCICISI